MLKVTNGGPMRNSADLAQAINPGFWMGTEAVALGCGGCRDLSLSLRTLGRGPWTVARPEVWSMKLPPCWWLQPCCPRGAPQVPFNPPGPAGGAGRKGAWFQKDCRVTRLLAHCRWGRSPGGKAQWWAHFLVIVPLWILASVFFNNTPQDLQIR